MAEKNLDAVKKILIEATEYLCNNLEPSDLLRKLKTKEALKPTDIEKIKGETTSEEQVEKMIDILQKKPISAYETFMEILKVERPDLFTHVEAIEKKHKYNPRKGTADTSPSGASGSGSSSSASGVKISSSDIRDVTRKAKLTKDELRTLFDVLGLEENEIENAEEIADAKDYKLKAASVLRYWMRTNGNAATRQKIIDALQECELTDARETLEGLWGI